MPDWTTILKQHHSVAHPDDGFELVLVQPASDKELDALAAKLDIELPAEFRSFYLTHNGFGLSHESEPDAVSWFFKPLGQIESFADSVRNWFTETHKDYAARFFPFIDFENGDGLGYMADVSGGILDGLFCFEHECYKFDEDQDVNEFLTHAPITVQEFLSQT